MATDRSGFKQSGCFDIDENGLRFVPSPDALPTSTDPAAHAWIADRDDRQGRGGVANWTEGSCAGCRTTPGRPGQAANVADDLAQRGAPRRSRR